MPEADIRTSLEQALMAGQISAEEFRRRLAESLPPAAAPERPALAAVADQLRTGALQGAALARVNWRKADLSNARLAAAVLSKAKLSKANLEGADLAGANFAGADLEGVNLRGANLVGADLTGASLKGADLTGARLTHATAKTVQAIGAQWLEAHAAGADFGMADVSRGEMEKACFAGADFTDAALDEVKVKQADWAGANLTRASMQNAVLEDVALRGAVAPRLVLNLAALTRVDLSGADLTKADVANAFLEAVNLSGAKLPGAVFNVSEHREVSLEGAELAGASFKSMVGYDEAALQRLGGLGARVDKFYLRRFGRLMRRSRVAQLVAALVLLAMAGTAIWYVREPEHWSFAKLDDEAMKRRGKGDYAGAEELYRIMLRKFVNQAAKIGTTRNALARLLIDTRRFEEAEGLLRSVIQDFPDQTGAVLGAEVTMADLYREQGKFPETEQLLLSITERYKDHPQVLDAWERLAKLYKFLGNEEKAREIYEIIIARTTLDENAVIRAQFELAQMLHDTGDLDGSIAKYREIIARFADPKTGGSALGAIIQIEVERNNLPGAERVLAELKQRFPNETATITDAEIFYAGAMLDDTAHEQEGLAALQRIYRDNPANERGYWAGKSLADYEKRARRYDRTAALLAELQLRFKDNLNHQRELTALLAELDLLQGKPAEALKRLNEALKGVNEPGQARTVLTLQARALAAMGRLDQARTTFRRLAEMFPEDQETRVSALLGEADLLDTANRLDEAVAIYRQVAESSLQPVQQFDALQRIAAIKRKAEDNVGEARELAAMATRFSDNAVLTAQVLLLQADNLRRRDEPKDALALLRRVADMNMPNRPGEALQAMLQIYAQLGDAANVAKIGEEIADRFPNDRRALLTARLENAGLLLRQGNIPGAIAEYDAVARAGEPAFRLTALQALLQVYVDQQQSAPAKQIFDALNTEYATRAEEINDATLTYAGLLRQLGRGDDAAALYERLAKRTAGTRPALWAYAGLAQHYLEQTRYGEAAQAYQRALNDPAAALFAEERVRALHGLGLIAEYQREFDEATGYYQKALAAAETLDQRLFVQRSLVHLAATKGDIDEGQKLLATLRREYPQHVSELEDSELRLLQALAQANRTDEAIAGYERLASTTKSRAVLASALAAIAQAYLSESRLDQAEKAFQRLKRTFADEPAQQEAADLGLAGIARQSGNFTRAAALYQKIADATTDRTTRKQALVAAAGIYAETGRVAQARAIYQRLQADATGHPADEAAALQGLADLLAREGAVDEAVTQYRKVLALPIDDAAKISVYATLAQLYAQLGRHEQARAVYAEMAQKFPQSADGLTEARFGEAEAFRQAGRYDAAVPIYQELIRRAVTLDGQVRAQIALARTHIDMKDYEAARQILAKVVQNPKVAVSLQTEARMSLADLYHRAGDLDASVAAYEDAAKRTGDLNVKQLARATIASLRLEQDRLDEAEKIFASMAQSTAATGHRVEGLMGLADIAQRRAQYDRARQYYQQVRKMDIDAQTDLNALFAVAQSYVSQKQYDGARRTFDEILSRYGKNRQARLEAELGLAHLLRDRGQYEQALAAYQKFADQYQGAAQVYWALSGIAQIYGEQGQVDKAAAAYAEIARRFPENATGQADAALNHANVLRGTGRREEAEKTYQDLLKRFPGTPQAAAAREGLAQMSLDFQDYARAKQDFQRLLNDFGQDPDAKFRATIGLATVARQEGNPAEAMKILNQSMQLAKRRDQKIHVLISTAQLYRETERLTDADNTFARLLKEYGDHPWARTEAMMGRGQIRLAQGKTDEAIANFAKVAEEFRGQPAASAALQSWAGAEIDRGRLDRAGPLVERLVKEHADDPNAAINVYMNMANRLMTENRHAEAERLLDSVIANYKTQPQTVWVRHLQAQVALAQKKYDRARQIFEAIRREFNGNRSAVIDAELGLADLARVQGAIDDAVTRYEAIADQYASYSQAVRALQALAEIYGERRQNTEQENAYRRIINEHANDRQAAIGARLGIANLLAARQRDSEALREFQTIYEEYPDSDQAIWAKSAAARLFLQLGQAKKAEQLLKEIIASAPADHEAVVGAQQLLEQMYNRR
jgi:tetratricopeptide (TPR) repeat protein